MARRFGPPLGGTAKGRARRLCRSGCAETRVVHPVRELPRTELVRPSAAGRAPSVRALPEDVRVSTSHAELQEHALAGPGCWAIRCPRFCGRGLLDDSCP